MGLLQKIIDGISLRGASIFQPVAGRDPAGNSQLLLTDTAGRVQTVGSVPGLSIPPHDFVGLVYVGTTNNLASVTYKTGGESGTVVATLTFAYVGGVPSANDATVASITKT